MKNVCFLCFLLSLKGTQTETLYSQKTQKRKDRRKSERRRREKGGKPNWEVNGINVDDVKLNDILSLVQEYMEMHL